VVGGIERLPMTGEIVGFAGHRMSLRERDEKASDAERGPAKIRLRIVADPGAENEECVLEGHGDNLEDYPKFVTRYTQPVVSQFESGESSKYPGSALICCG
jgi:hypothetical protein